MKTIQVRRTRHAGHCWRSRNELRSDVLLWTPTYGWAKAGRAALKTRQRRWTIGRSGERGCGISVLAARPDDDDEWCMLVAFARSLICMESNTLAKSKNNSVTSRFSARTHSIILSIVWMCDVMDQFLWKQFNFFPKNVVNFRLDTIEKQNNINLCNYNRKSNESVIHCDSVANFYPFLNILLQKRRCMSGNFLVFHSSRVISSKSECFWF